MLRLIFIAIGGSIGAVSRYIIDLNITNAFSMQFPLGTLTVNLIGCFIIGVAFKIFYHGIIDSKYNPLIITGFLGALTTFSSYAYTTLILFEKGQYFIAGINLLANNIFGILFAFLGAKFANYIIKTYFNDKFKGEKL